MDTDFTHSIRVEAPPSSIRAALTTPSGIQGWWAKDCEVSAEVGGRNELRFDKGGTTVVMRFRVDVVAADRVVWTCTENGNPVWVGTTLVWAFRESGGATEVTFTQRDLRMVGSPPYQATVQTWPAFQESLKAWVETGVGRPW